MMNTSGDSRTTRLSALVAEALRRLANAGVDVSPIHVYMRENVIELGRGRNTLVVLPSPNPSAAVILVELLTFLLPLPDALVRRVAHEIGGGSLWLDPLVDVRDYDPTLIIETRYATRRNVAGRALYPSSMRTHCFVRRSTAAALHRAQMILRRQGYSLKLWDGYRPHSIQRRCVDPRIIPDPAIRRLFVPPHQGSNHGRGCAVDATLVDLRTGNECVLPTDFDTASPRAFSRATNGLTREQVRNRRRLHAAMDHAGFVPLRHEWWHFNYRPDGRRDKSRNAGDLYLVLDLPFDLLLRQRSVQRG